MNLANLDLYLVILLAYFAVAGPLLSRWKMADLRRDLATDAPAARLRLYDQTMIFEWALTAALLGWWLLLGRSPDAIGLHLGMAGWQWIVLAVCLVATLQYVLSVHRASRDPKQLGDVRDQLGPLASMVPHSAVELRRFTWLSITAGICEEILYRGLLLTALAAVTGLWPAVLLSSVLFGIGHAYQGPSGILRTGLAGLALALVVVFTGSLLTGMMVHAVLDIVQGRLTRAAVGGHGPLVERPA